MTKGNVVLSIKVDLEARTFEAGPLRGKAWSDVRNELNGLRLKSEVAVRSTNKDGSDGVTYMPRQFPKGKWRVTYVKAADPNDTYLWPYFIGTDATQKVEEWSTTWDGRYEGKTGRVVDDYGYGLHYSSSNTTLGCIRIEKQKDLVVLADMVQAALLDGIVELEVV